MKLTIEVYWDALAVYQGRTGCYVARIKEDPGVHDAGATRQKAIENLMKTAKTHRLSGNQNDYAVEFHPSHS